MDKRRPGYRDALILRFRLSPEMFLTNNQYRFLRTIAFHLATVLLLQPAVLHGQSGGAVSFEEHCRRANTYSDASVFGPAIDELNEAIELATKNHQEKQRIEAVIALSELMRKTGDFEKGAALLHSLENAPDYPELQTRRLERMAAIWSEWRNSGIPGLQDSVSLYLDSALRLSEKVRLPELEASICNQLGFHAIETDRAKGFTFLQKAAAIFLSIGDTHNYVGAQTNLLRCYLRDQDSGHAGKIIRQLLPLVKGRKWFTAEIELYRLCASHANQFYHDEAAVRYWNSLADQRLIANLEAANTAQVNAFRTLYETRKLQNELNTKQENLERETRRTRELILFSVALSLMAAIVLVLLLRERKLRKQLKSINADLEKSAEKYRLLMVESNHRIKNNLQMVISMLHYDGQEITSDPSKTFQRMAQKIRTIGALHRHLSADEHNELVPLDAYFRTISELYLDMAPGMRRVHCQVEPVSIRSERIVYFGLILNEMLANTVEHGAASDDAIMLKVKPDGEGYRFHYTDSSAHLPSAARGTGSTLIVQLIARIGGSDFHFDPSTGHYQFFFHGKD